MQKPIKMKIYNQYIITLYIYIYILKHYFKTKSMACSTVFVNLLLNSRRWVRHYCKCHAHSRMWGPLLIKSKYKTKLFQILCTTRGCMVHRHKSYFTSLFSWFWMLALRKSKSNNLELNGLMCHELNFNVLKSLAIQKIENKRYTLRLW